MKEILEYKNYTGTVEVSVEDNCLHGKILHIRDLVTYEAETVEQLKEEFEAAIDNYLQSCERLGVEPKKPCSGTFNVRIGADLHLHAVETATRKNSSLNDFVKEAIAHEVEKAEEQKAVHHHYHQTFVIKQDIGETDSQGRISSDETITRSRLILGSRQTINH